MVRLDNLKKFMKKKRTKTDIVKYATEYYDKKGYVSLEEFGQK
jgi:aspartyl aminopeptidase